MTDPAGEGPALRPLWAMTIGALAGSGAAMVLPNSGPGWLHLVLILTGIAFMVGALRRGRSAPVALWLIGGLALVGGHGLSVADGRHQLAEMIDLEDSVWVRAQMVVTEGWTRGRWGWRSRIRVLEARRQDNEIPDLIRCRLEIRGSVQPRDLPRPGALIHGLVSIRGSPSTPLLVASSIRLIDTAPGSRPLPSIRDRLAGSLLASAGVDVERIRAAELAAALSLGRRDLIPPDRRDGWRRSGFAHVLAVSGLHVGLVAGMAWLALSATGRSPTTSRLVILALLPTYALLAGASPSAVRAALMGVIYLGARLLGRAIVPMAAVLLTTILLLLADPSLVAEVSFQLTVLLTAALVRWAPPLTAAIPLPTWLAAAVAVPVIAQLAAAPLVAYHFSSMIPGAALSNLLVPWLLGPVVLASVAATAIAPISATVAGWLLDLVDLGARVLWISGSPGRSAEFVPPALPLGIVIGIAGIGLAALLPGRRARFGVAAYAGILVALAIWSFVPASNMTEVELLPVSYGLALHINSDGDHVLMDGGGARREAAEMLATRRVRRLAAVVASHGDEDHIAGLVDVMRTTTVETLIVPAWLLRQPESADLLRTARKRGVRIQPVTRGSRLDLGSPVIEVLWPPARDLPSHENERSIVARVHLESSTVLLTADVGKTTEDHLMANTDLSCTILIVPHHGSRHSASPDFLDATKAQFALIPAGPENLHHHPHPEVIGRLNERTMAYRMPIRDGRCGVRWVDGEWGLYPEVVTTNE